MVAAMSRATERVVREAIRAKAAERAYGGIADHNAERWLEVRFLLSRPMLMPGDGWVGPGWYVLRVCPCHLHHSVTRQPQSNQGEALRIKDLLLSASARLDGSDDGQGRCPAARG
jgi:hypothetical protein